MKILLLCTAHNSLSQQLYLALSTHHEITVEYALSPDTMIEAASMTQPHLIICPFLTSLVPAEVYTKYMTFIVHPGAPGDGGPSALDFVIMGEDGTVADVEKLLEEDAWSEDGRSHWAVTVIQAIADFDAGPIWAFDQFSLDIDDQELTKSSLYRGDVTRAAISVCLSAIERAEAAAYATASDQSDRAACWTLITPDLEAKSEYRTASVTTGQPFLGGQTKPLPLLKASQRDFDINRHSARTISRRIRASDSQPGCLTTLFTPSLYVYGGCIEDGEHMSSIQATPGTIIGARNDAVCIKTVDGKGIWITHARRVKKKCDSSLWPKVPAVTLLTELKILDPKNVPQLLPSLPADFHKLDYQTFQEVDVKYDTLSAGQRVAYLTFNFYNGAMSTKQCIQTSAALRCILATHTTASPLSAVVLLGGSYFSNGIHLNVIEAAADPAGESWANINAINDVVLLLLQDFAAQNITTVAALRGNAAAGGVALAAAADLVIAGEHAVLNPAYRALGLFGSEYHTLTYPGRVGHATARHLLRDMLPISAYQAKAIGLIDAILPGHGKALDDAIHARVTATVLSARKPGRWKSRIDLSPPALAAARTAELAEMSKDFWSARSPRYHSRRRDFVRKVKASKTPLRFAVHRRGVGELDEEESDAFDAVESFAALVRRAQEQALVEAVEELRAQARRASTPITVAEKERRKLELMFSCYYGA